MHRDPDMTGSIAIPGGRLIEFASLPSTNRWALDHPDACRPGDVVWARSQTAGRGRFSRTWYSPSTDCLTISVVLKIDSLGALPPSSIGPVGALAVRRTLSDHGIRALVKWPNDVMTEGGKIAGLLAESDLDAGRLVLGIGLNVNLSPADLPASDVPQPVTSMLVESGHESAVEDVLRELASHLAAVLKTAAGHDGTRLLLKEWAEHDALAGHRLRVVTEHGEVCGTYAGIEADGRLCVVCDSGAKSRFWSGDVTIAK